MPFLTLKTNTVIDSEQELKLKAALGEAVSALPGKNEGNLLLEIEDERRLWLAGTNEQPIVLIEACIFASEDRIGYDEFVLAATRAVAHVLGIDHARIYIRFEDIPAWGLGGRWVSRG